jgi:hypothetical protein
MAWYVPWNPTTSSESFLSEVGGSAKTDRQVDPPDGLFLLPWHDSMEAPDAGSEVRPRDPQKVEGLGINDVKTVASIHEHLGEACVSDDGIDNKWVDPRIGDVVWVVITVESDGHLGPVKEEGVASCMEKTSLCSRLCCHVERRVEGPPYIMKQSWISGNPSSLSPLGSFFLSSFLTPMLSKYLQSMWQSSRLWFVGPLW